MQIINSIKKIAVSNPDKIALSDGARDITYKNLEAEILAAAAHLHAAGCKRLAIAGDNSIDWILYDLAALTLKIPVTPLPPFFHAAQRDAALKAAGITHIVLGTSIVATGYETYDVTLPDGTDKITYTSGSTGDPKGVCLTQAGLEKVALSLAAALGTEHVGKHLCVLPLAVLLENVAGVYTALMTGATVYVPPLAAIGFTDIFQPNFTALLDVMNAQKITSVILVPEILHGLMFSIQQTGKVPDSLTFAAVGGAKVDPDMLIAAHAAGLPVYEGYGLSECGSVIALNTPRKCAPATSGKILPHVDVKVEDGEIVVENPCFLGYLGDAPRPNTSFPTGDLGSIDTDGFVTLTGRCKNMIITGYGRNIAPEWVESILLAQPAIRQAVVFGEGAENIGALIVPMKEDADIASAIATANQKLPAYAHVKHFRVIPTLTADKGFLTGNGRIKRNNVLKHFLKEKTMTFYERLQKETEPARQSLYMVPQLTDGLRGDISRETYVAYLTEAYHHVKHTVRFLMAMGARLPEEKKWLHDAIAEYIDEEKGHEEWILNDIAAAGGDKETARHATPNLETQVLVAYNYDYIARKNPVGFLGMVFMLESTSTQIASNGADAIMAGLKLPKTAFTYLYSHGALDIEHLKFFESLVNKIDDADDQAAIIEVANNTFRLFAQVLSAIPHKKVQKNAA